MYGRKKKKRNWLCNRYLNIHLLFKLNCKFVILNMMKNVFLFYLKSKMETLRGKEQNAIQLDGANAKKCLKKKNVLLCDNGVRCLNQNWYWSWPNQTLKKALFGCRQQYESHNNETYNLILWIWVIFECPKPTFHGINIILAAIALPAQLLVHFPTGKRYELWMFLVFGLKMLKNINQLTHFPT